MWKRFFFGAFVGGVAAAVSIPAAEAHHGWSGQSQAQSELTGTVSRALSLAGPHATMQIEDDQGQEWEVTLAPPSRTSRAGLAEDTIPLGATVTVSGHRNDAPGRREIKTERVTYDGTNYDVYPDRL